MTQKKGIFFHVGKSAPPPPVPPPLCDNTEKYILGKKKKQEIKQNSKNLARSPRGEHAPLKGGGLAPWAQIIFKCLCINRGGMNRQIIFGDKNGTHAVIGNWH